MAMAPHAASRAHLLRFLRCHWQFYQAHTTHLTQTMTQQSSNKQSRLRPLRRHRQSCLMTQALILPIILLSLALSILPSLPQLSLFPVATAQSVPQSSAGSANSANRPRYKVYSLPPFEVQLDIDLWTTAVNGEFLNHRRRGLNDGQYTLDSGPEQLGGYEFDNGSSSNNYPNNQDENDEDPNPFQSLQSLKKALRPTSTSTDSSLSEYIRALLVEYTTDYMTTFAHEALRTDERASKGWDLVHAIDLRGEMLGVEFYQSETYYLDQGGPGRDRRRNERGRHLRLDDGSIQQSRKLEQPSRNEEAAMSESEETFASLTFSFSGTAAILLGKNTTKSETGDESSMTNVSIYRRPTIGKEELRLMLRGSFAPPDGPYVFLSIVLESAAHDRQMGYQSVDAVDSMTKSDIMEHDAAVVLSGARQVKARTDLDLFPGADFLGPDDATNSGSGIAPYGGSGNGVGYAPSTIWITPSGANAQAERRESITVFLQGVYLVVFLGGFYMYASYKYRRMHLKQELYRYGKDFSDGDAILVRNFSKDGEDDEDSEEGTGLFSKSALNGSKFPFGRGGVQTTRLGQLGYGGKRHKIVDFLLGRNDNRKSGKNGGAMLQSHSTTMDVDDEDLFFEKELSGIESSDEGDAPTPSSDMEMGLKESYAESHANKKGLDMEPIDADTHGIEHSRSPGSNTMKAVDDEMKERSMPPSGGWGNVLDNVVPIPASDAVGGMDDRNSTYHPSGAKKKESKGDKNGSVIVQRRYVQPASPFDVLYGAAFLHGEAERVEAQRRHKMHKQKIRSSPSGRKRKKKKKPSNMKLVMEAMNGQKSKDSVKPMMTISEVEDSNGAGRGKKDTILEEEEYESEEESEEEESSSKYDGLGQLGPGELRHNASSMSFYSPSNFMRNLSEKYNLGLFDGPINDEDAVNDDGGAHVPDSNVFHATSESLQQDFPVEEGVVFKDFPRQDGSPCIVYDSESKVLKPKMPDPTVSAPQAMLHDNAIVENSDSIFDDDVGNDINNSIHSNSESIAEPSDEFATKLGIILDSKRLQIEERKQMEEEREARRKEREERKKKADEAKKNIVEDGGEDDERTGHEIV